MKDKQMSAQHYEIVDVRVCPACRRTDRVRFRETEDRDFVAVCGCGASWFAVKWIEVDWDAFLNGSPS